MNYDGDPEIQPQHGSEQKVFIKNLSGRELLREYISGNSAERKNRLETGIALRLMCGSEALACRV